MAVYKAVFRVEPVHESDLAAMEEHHRHEGMPSLHIDEARSHLNEVLIGTGHPMQDTYSVIDERGLVKANKNGPIAGEMILTASREFFNQEFPGWQSDSSLLKPWIDSNMKALNSGKFGLVTSAILHLDEEAPHIHAVGLPVARVKYKNGNSESYKERISYSSFYADQLKVIREARRMRTTSTDTRLGRMQTDYASFVSEVGLIRGATGIQRKHVSPRDYRETLEVSSPEPLNFPVIPSPPDVEKTFLGGIKKDSANNLFEYAKSLERQLKEVMPFVKKTNELALANELLNREVVHLTNVKNSLENDVNALTLAQAEQVNLMRQNKIYLGVLRNLTPALVTERMGYKQDDLSAYNDTLSEKKQFNAIDYVKNVERCDFNTAVFQLASAFPEHKDEVCYAGGSYVEAHKREELEKFEKEPERDLPRSVQLTKSQRVKSDLVDRQLTAIGAESYRVTLMSSDKDKPTINLGKGKGVEGGEKFYTKEEIKDITSTLSYRNAHGYNIFITPMPNAEKRFILVDDIRDHELAVKLDPAVILKTSKRSEQALYVVDVSGFDAEKARDASLDIFKSFNKYFGDEKISGEIHPMRLAGYTNQKEKHKDDETGLNPFVELIHAKPVVSETVTKMLFDIVESSLLFDENREKALAKQSEAMKNVGRKTLEITALPTSSSPTQPTPDASAFYRDQINYWNSRPGISADLSKIDFNLAKNLRDGGYTREQAKQSIVLYSPRFQARHGHESEKYLAGKVDYAFDEQMREEQASRGMER